MDYQPPRSTWKLPRNPETEPIGGNRTADHLDGLTIAEISATEPIPVEAQPAPTAFTPTDTATAPMPVPTSPMNAEEWPADPPEPLSLEGLLDGDEWNSPEPGEDDDDDDSAGLVEPKASTTFAAWFQRNSTPIIVGIATLALVVGGVGTMVLLDQDDGAPQPTPTAPQTTTPVETTRTPADDFPNSGFGDRPSRPAPDREVPNDEPEAPLEEPRVEQEVRPAPAPVQEPVVPDAPKPAPKPAEPEAPPAQAPKPAPVEEPVEPAVPAEPVEPDEPPAPEEPATSGTIGGG